MTDALINDKPQFVRLFTENGLSILKYLTYGRLENLYRSVGDGTLLYQLLQRFLVERLGTTPPVPILPETGLTVGEDTHRRGPDAEISLFEVCSLIIFDELCSCFCLRQYKKYLLLYLLFL